MLTNTEIFEENKKIVTYCYSQLNKNEFTIKHKEDLLQEGFLAMWKAINTYDSERGESLPAYIFPCVKNAMLNFIRSSSKVQFDTLSLDAPIKSTYEDYDITLSDFLHVNDFEDSTEELITSILSSYSRWLKKRHKHIETVELRLARAKIIIDDALIEGKAKARTIETKYGINRTTVSQILSEIRHVLKEEYPTRFKNRRQHKYET